MIVRKSIWTFYPPRFSVILYQKFHIACLFGGLIEENCEKHYLILNTWTVGLALLVHQESPEDLCLDTADLSCIDILSAFVVLYVLCVNGLRFNCSRICLSFFLIGSGGFTPTPHPLSGPATKKNTFYISTRTILSTNLLLDMFVISVV